MRRAIYIFYEPGRHIKIVSETESEEGDREVDL